jgi:hypothetical protein
MHSTVDGSKNVFCATPLRSRGLGMNIWASDQWFKMGIYTPQYCFLAGQIGGSSQFLVIKFRFTYQTVTCVLTSLTLLKSVDSRKFDLVRNAHSDSPIL